MIRGTISLLKRMRRETEGAVLTETIVVVPFVTLFSVGILEFGNMFWQKEQIETGLRDAARYLARCQPTSTAFPTECSATVARNIAVYGTAAPADSAPPRVPGWEADEDDITISEPVSGVIRVAADHDYESSPLFGWLGIAGTISIEAYHDERYVGW